MKRIFNVFIIIAISVISVTGTENFHIINPYKDVNWNKYGQYKAALHVHTTNSDGQTKRTGMIEKHYKENYDILAITDHNFLTAAWAEPGFGAWDRHEGGRAGVGLLSMKRKAEMEAGIGRGGKGMIELSYTNEQSASDHINTFFTNYNNTPRNDKTRPEKLIETIEAVQNIGGISVINHPGRETGRYYNTDLNSDVKARANDPENIKRYADIFMKYPSVLGMEIINGIDSRRNRADRILWDNILKETMQKGRFVWGFSNDDAHNKISVGYSYNIMLMPKLNEADVRTAIKTGAFYAVSHADYNEGIRFKLFAKTKKMPSITNITVSGSTITVTGKNYDKIEWISDGVKIAFGNSINISDFSDKTGNYVRAQLKSKHGIAYTQPFGIIKELP